MNSTSFFCKWQSLNVNAQATNVVNGYTPFYHIQIYCGAPVDTNVQDYSKQKELSEDSTQILKKKQKKLFDNLSVIHT